MPDAAPPKKPLCFVIGPIGDAGTEVRKHADFLLHGIIRLVLEADEFGYKVKRADEDADPGMIGDRVITDLIHADLVVADLTGLNPNALYELGIRHAAEKPVIHIAKDGTQLPFDNHAHRAIFVDVADWRNLEEARERLAASARAIKETGFKVSNPITQANASFQMRESADPREQVIAGLQERVAALEVQGAEATRNALAAYNVLAAQNTLAATAAFRDVPFGVDTRRNLPKSALALGEHNDLTSPPLIPTG